MIIVALFEGLANQMFQYATARCLAEKYSTEIKLDISCFESNRRRKYGLHCFNIQEHIASQYEVDLLLNRPKNRVDKYWKNTLQKIGVSSRSNMILLQENFFHFNQNILEAPNNTYLWGFWQSEKYFIDIREILLREFSIKYPLSVQSKETSEKIKFHESISLHIRRGDYVQDEKSHQLHGVCDLDYYDRCIEYMNKKVNNPHFFVFSDDPQWAKDNLKCHIPITIIDHNSGLRSYEDLHLMSQCKHNIIANSSFSWWGAWLNSNPDKIVCAPQQWFKMNSTDTKYSISEGPIPWFKDNLLDAKDLIPGDWIKF